MKKTGIGNICTTPRNLNSIPPVKCSKYAGRRCRIRNPHLSHRKDTVSFFYFIFCDFNTGFYGVNRLCPAHGRPFCYVLGSESNFSVKQTGHITHVRIDSHIHYDHMSTAIMSQSIGWCAFYIHIRFYHAYSCRLGVSRYFLTIHAMIRTSHHHTAFRNLG